MKRIFEYFISKVYRDYQIYKEVFNRLVRNTDSYLYKSEWMLSRKNGFPCKANGDAVPWMNSPVISFLEERQTKDINIFEYGSGYSTISYARHVDRVTSCEYDKDWFALIGEMVPKNVELIFRGKDVKGRCCTSILDVEDKYDLVIVDGRDRVNCIKQCIASLSALGVILLDDSSRDGPKLGIEYAVDRGFRALGFEGLKAFGDGAAHRTTIFCRNDNRLGL